MTTDEAIDVTTLVWGITALACLIVAIPNAIRLIGTRRTSDQLWPFRLMSTLLFGSFGLAMLRNLAVWADLAYFDQRYLGSIARRWPLDLGLALLIMVATVYAAMLYIRVQREAPSALGSPPPPEQP